MSDNNQPAKDFSEGDSKADSIAELAIMSIIGVTVVY